MRVFYPLPSPNATCDLSPTPGGLSGRKAPAQKS